MRAVSVCGRFPCRHSNHMSIKPKNAIAGLIIAGAVSLGAYDKANISKGEFADMVPTIEARDSRGNAYGHRNKDLNGKGLNQLEKHFAEAVLDGYGPTGGGSLSVEEIQQLYFDTAVKMGLTIEDTLSGGVDLYEYIRLE